MNKITAIADVVEKVLSAARPPVNITDENGRPRPQATILTEIGQRHGLFHDAGGDAYARTRIQDGHAVFAIASAGYRDVLGREFYALSKKGANRNSLADAIGTLGAIAKYDRAEYPVWLRVGETVDGIEIDTGSAKWDSILVTSDGWKRSKEHTVRMRRSGKPVALPDPSERCDFGKLWEYVNVAEDDRVLVAGFLLAALRPRGPYPILLLVGEQGSAKSSTSRIVKRLTDPSAVNLRAPPRDETDLLVAAASSWVLALDNLSGVSPQMSDALCRLSTGGGFARRTLYTTSDETLIEVQRPVIINGIDDLASRPDLADRCLHISTPPIQNRRSEAELEVGFRKDAPAIFSALLDGLARAIRYHGNTEIGGLPRMADFAKWAAAGVPALGFTCRQFVEAYWRNQSDAVEMGLETSHVAVTLRKLVGEKPFYGTATELLRLLDSAAGNDTAEGEGWPKSARALSNLLRRLTPSLRKIGMTVEGRREPGTGQRLIQVTCMSGIHSSHASQPPCCVGRGVVTV